MKDAIRIVSFADSSVFPENAAVAIKMDMVKPTPASRPAATICSQRIPWGSRAQPSFTATKLNAAIPSGLPTQRPSRMPRFTGAVGFVAVSYTHLRAHET